MVYEDFTSPEELLLVVKQPLPYFWTTALTTII